MYKSKSPIIIDLCSKFRDSCKCGDGFFYNSDVHRKLRLIRNGIVFHELDLKDLQTCCIGLSNVLLSKKLGAMYSYDHYLFWAWTAEVLTYSHPRAPFFEYDMAGIKELFVNTVRVGLPFPVKITYNNNTTDPTQLFYNLGLIQTYLSLPLLEALIGNLCMKAGYIDINGKVLIDFSVPGNKARRNYVVKKKIESSNNEWKSDRCSNIRDLLYLFNEKVADQDLSEKLKEFCEYLSTIAYPQHIYDLIGQWRNKALHGTKVRATIGGVILNLFILVALNLVKDDYEYLKNMVLNKVKMDYELKNVFIPPHSYYAPLLDIYQNIPESSSIIIKDNTNANTFYNV